MSKQKEIGRIVVSDYYDLVVSVVNDTKLDIRMHARGTEHADSYEGPTKRGVRFSLNSNWEAFKDLMKKVDKFFEGNF